jgi:hypothetical protein
LMIRQAISPRLAIRIRLNMPEGDPNQAGPMDLRCCGEKVNRGGGMTVVLQFRRHGGVSAAGSGFAA